MKKKSEAEADKRLIKHLRGGIWGVPETNKSMIFLTVFYSVLFLCYYLLGLSMMYNFSNFQYFKFMAPSPLIIDSIYKFMTCFMDFNNYCQI